MKYLRFSDSKGDTIIEVLLAMTLLTLILFTSWGLVNRSTQLSLAARKRIDMVNQLKEQAEILKAKFAETGSSEDVIKALNDPLLRVQKSVTTYDEDFCNESTANGARPNTFHYNDDAVMAENAIVTDGVQAVWIEYTGTPTTDGYADFYVRGCWLTSGGQQKTDNAQFIVRLNK